VSGAVAGQPLVLTGVAELEASAGKELGASDYHLVSQEDVNTFADVTGDHNWIHVDVERAAASPFGGTIVHGFFTLSLAPRLFDRVVSVAGFEHALNYGLNKVRFPAPLPVGERVRLRVTLAEVTPAGDGAQCVFAIAFEREGGDKPVCVAEWVARYAAPVS
jgi:acyl dehydratase